MPQARCRLTPETRHRRALVPTIIIVLLSGCGEAATSTSSATAGRVTITGSSTMAPLVGEMAQRFEATHDEARIDVQSGGSSRGIADVIRATADLGMSSRALHEDEATALREHVLALDGVTFIVNERNAIESLTTVQARELLTGKVTNWNELGGDDAPITMIQRAAGRSEVDLMTAHLNLSPADLRGDVIAGENQQGIKLVAGDPHGVTYMSIGTSLTEMELGTTIRMLAMDGVAATRGNVQSGAFPVVRPLVLLRREDLSPLGDHFLEFVMSNAVHDLIEEHGFVPPRQ